MRQLIQIAFILGSILGCSCSTEESQTQTSGPRISPRDVDGKLRGIEVLDYTAALTSRARSESADKLSFKANDVFELSLTFRDENRLAAELPAVAEIAVKRPRGRDLVVDQSGSMVESVGGGVFQLKADDLEIHALRPGTYILRAHNENGIIWEKELSVTQ